MSLSHKAFAFDWSAFELELAPQLKLGLQRGDTELLEGFIEAHRKSLRDPYEGEPLPEDWRNLLEAGDIQELADFALTRYYLPSADFGVGEEWSVLSEMASEAERHAMLGSAFESFDPGRMGSYFQSSRIAAASLQILGTLGDGPSEVFKDGLRKAVNSGLGIYVTF
jgi:hypothetical protein